MLRTTNLLPIWPLNANYNSQIDTPLWSMIVKSATYTTQNLKNYNLLFRDQSSEQIVLRYGMRNKLLIVSLTFMIHLTLSLELQNSQLLGKISFPVAQGKNNPSVLLLNNMKDEARMYLVATYLQCAIRHIVTYRVDKEGRQAGTPIVAWRGGVHGQDTLQGFGKLFTKGFLRGSPKVGRRKRCRQRWWWSGRSTERDVGKRR